jgi:hypothetical protein
LRIVSSGNPRSRAAARISPLSIAPTVRCTLRIGSLISIGVPLSIESRANSISFVVQRFERPWSAPQRRAMRLGISG